MRAPILAFLAFLAGGSALGTTPVIDPSGCAAGDHPICVALRIEDSEQREAALRQAVRDTLLSPEPEGRDRAWRILSEVAWKTNLFPCLDLIEAFTPLAQKYQNVAELADRIEMVSAPRPQRLALLAPAILSGSGRLARGTSVLRTAAIFQAARQGLVEFLPAVTEYLAALEPERIRARRMVSILAMFELSEGATTGFDAPAVAFRRILAMDERTLENRFLADEGFREAVFSLLNEPCRPFGAPKESESCSLLRQIVLRQLEYRGTPAPDGVILGRSGDWLGRLQGILSPY